MGASFQETVPAESELHLGTNSVLAIFLGITLVSAVFFGLGYSFGRTGGGVHLNNPLHSMSNPPATPNAGGDTPNGVAPAAADGTAAQKPSAIAASTSTAPDANTQEQQPAQPLALVPAPDQSPSAPASNVGNANSAGNASKEHHGSSTAAPLPAAASSAQPSSRSDAKYVVQVAAVASRKDAETLVTALKKHGMEANVRSGQHDKFFHVQIGHFTTQQTAEAMRQKVIAAGYKAILKPTP